MKKVYAFEIYVKSIRYVPYIIRVVGYIIFSSTLYLLFGASLHPTIFRLGIVDIIGAFDLPSQRVPFFKLGLPGVGILHFLA